MNKLMLSLLLLMSQSCKTVQTSSLSDELSISPKLIQIALNYFDPNAENLMIAVLTDAQAEEVEKSIEDIFRAILDIIMVFAVPIILFFVVYAGFLYVTAQGNASKIGEAHKALRGTR